MIKEIIVDEVLKSGLFGLNYTRHIVTVTLNKKGFVKSVNSKIVHHRLFGKDLVLVDHVSNIEYMKITYYSGVLRVGVLGKKTDGSVYIRRCDDCDRELLYELDLKPYM